MAQNFLKILVYFLFVVCYSTNQREGKGPTQGAREHTVYQNFETLNDLIEYLQELFDQYDWSGE